MNIKCLYSFNNCHDFSIFTNFIEISNWRIEKQLLKERVEKYEFIDSFQKFKQRFYAQKLSIWDLKLEEVITWHDTLLIMRRTIKEISKSEVNLDKLKIIMEYPLIYGNHMRTDYLIIYERLIIVLEFGMFNQDEKRSEERYTKKLQDSITHRQVLRNMIDSQVKVVNYVLVYRPEYDRLKKTSIDANIEYNYQEINLLSRFILTHLLEQEELGAVNQLEMINIYK